MTPTKKDPPEPDKKDKTSKSAKEKEFDAEVAKLSEEIADVLSHNGETTTVTAVNACLRVAALLSAEDDLSLLRVVSYFAMELDRAQSFISQRRSEDLLSLLQLMSVPASGTKQ